jgi:hypothetical protein
VEGKAVLVVRATCDPDKVNAFNEWYNSDHSPRALQALEGALKVRRLMSIPEYEEKVELLAMYEFSDEQTLRTALNHPDIAALRDEYTATWAKDAPREAKIFLEILHLEKKG